MSIILDNRERDLMRLLRAESTVRVLDVGDAHIVCTDLSGSERTVVIAERKAVTDLESSLTDGRYREQRTRLLATCASTGAKPLYIVEGPLDRLHGRKTIEELWVILNRLTMRYGIALMLTDDVDQTAGYLKTLASQVAKDPQCFDASTIATSYSAYVKTSKKATKEDPRNFFVAMVTQCSGISAAIGEILATHYSGLEALMGASVEELAAVEKAPGKKVGKAVAGRLWGLLHASRESGPVVPAQEE